MIFSSSSKSLVRGSELCSELAVFLTEKKSDFESKLIPDLSHIDHMAHNANGIKIESVRYVEGIQYQLNYSFDWEVFRGCSDMNESGIERGRVSFTLDENGFLKIDFPNYDERDTSDEF
ncbi:hypothetical protein CSB62_06970 [Vibrio splendidus]|uniref:hypothetical protein n=1 Tax=Vibrio lentus TaxID=136468 RepID=UPI000C08C002|nr:hypothetical protein [Vibrio lentus]PHN87564.1 hypothetical protein CSB62_06970 [Vibrio splendidus]MCC4814996.1 hypothetical protein [Vibrio lentus]PME63395.1 hypothetical protein BCV33_18830 [Vibrio lentus]PMG59211.1 hypothetical protein BCU87_19230 [Vibrio lentus]PMG74648.1 hypothetical protein BCU85_00425 [Vibrio lentus]